MSIAIEQTIHAVQVTLQTVTVGTNIALLHLLWSMLNGSFLLGRGAIFPSLQLSGFSEDESRRSWAAMRYGVWRIDELVSSWRDYVQDEKKWKPNSYEGYRPIAIDNTIFWRPKLKGWAGKYFNGIANRASKGVGFAIVAEIGEVDGHRMPLIRTIIRAHPERMNGKALKNDALTQVGRNLAEDEIVVHDAGAYVSDMQECNVPRYVVRLAKNCTARRTYLPESKRGRPREYGHYVRPLARTRKGKEIAATKPDTETKFTHQGRIIKVHGWRNVVLTGHKVAEKHETFNIWVFFDPLYREPLVLGINVTVIPETAFHLYLDRWPVEQIPLTAKQMIGLHRHFVFAYESCQRLPELALLAANILTYLAAVLPPMPTGFWDRRPKKRQVVFGGSWGGLIFLKKPLLRGSFGKRGHQQTIYQRGFWHIDDKNDILDLLFGGSVVI